MTLYEFRERTREDVTPREYEVTNQVYTFHPSISNTQGKDQIAYLYMTFGFRIILDMLPTAQAMEEMENDLRVLQNEVDTKKAEIDDFSKGVR